ncbi:hypothetical protein [Streptomyces sp. NPDC060035]
MSTHRTPPEYAEALGALPAFPARADAIAYQAALHLAAILAWTRH